MKKRKLGIIGGSGLYKMEGFEKTKWKKVKTSWGQPSDEVMTCLLYTSPSPRDLSTSRMPSSA